MYRLLASAVNHPDSVNPYIGLFNHRTLRALEAIELDLDVISPRPFAPPVGPYSAYSSIPEREQWGPYEVAHPRFLYPLPKRLFYALAGDSFARRVPSYVERTISEPDVVHACHIYLDGYGMLPYCRRHDVPLFVVAHGAFLNGYDELPVGVRSRIDETLAAAAGIMCVSGALAEKAQRHVSGSKVETIPIGADPTRFPVDRRTELRHELDVDPEATVLLFVGEFCERKGVPELLEILPDLDLPNTDFVFIGYGGDLKRELTRTVARSDFSNKHVYTGVTSLALRSWLAVADALVLPSRAEGRPTVIYEAMASETAVVATDVGGIPEQVADGRTGILLPPRNPEALAAALRNLIGNRDRMRDMGRAGRRRLETNNWTWADHAERIKTLHEQAI
jgi:glycosyltransferase involved in cell wall biosynthesis